MKPRAFSAILAALAILASGASAAVRPADEFTVQDLARIAKDHGAKTIPELLNVLPEDLRQNVVLLRNSDSLQGADAENPRAIFWSERGKFAASFNGHEGQRGGQAIEAMQFNAAERKFHFYEVKLPLENAVTEPTSCLQCHGTDARPVWREYPVWANSYGSYGDILKGEERDAFLAFAKKAGLSPRYSTLPVEENSRSPYRPDDKIGPTNLSTGFAVRPNQRLGAMLSRLNAKRVARMIETHPQYANLRDTLMAALLSCDGFADESQLLAVLSQFGISKGDLDLRNHYDDPKNTALDAKLSYFDGAATAIEYLVAELLRDKDVSVRGLHDKYRAQSERNIIDAPFMTVLDELGLWFPIPYTASELTVKVQKREPYRPRFGDERRRVCKMLSPKMISVETTEKAPVQERPAGLKVIQSRCIGCHSGGFKIAFDDVKALEEQVNRDGSLIGKIEQRTRADLSEESRMPLLGTPLSEDERSALLGYLNSLKH